MTSTESPSGLSVWFLVAVAKRLRDPAAAEIPQRERGRDARQQNEELLADHGLPPSWY
jgi:hypothetical protein